MFCLNLCEILSPEGSLPISVPTLLEEFRAEGIKQPIERIYLGSSFCSQYFLHTYFWTNILNLCKTYSLPVTLTLPIFSEKDLVNGKKKIADILQLDSQVDEITVNDAGMALYIKENYPKLHLNLGRLFFKAARDIRVDGYYRASFAHPCGREMASEFGADGIELDLTHEKVTTTFGESSGNILTVAFHGPFCYQTTGNICKFASIHRELDQKFRPNSPCTAECRHIAECNVKLNQGTVLYRIGRTVYFYVPNYSEYLTEGDRFIYFPARELLGIGREGQP